MFDVDPEEFFDKITLSENIAHGQHVEEFEVHCFDDDKKKWRKTAKCSTIGYKRILNIKPGKYSKIKFVFTGYRDFFEISYIAVN